MIEYPGVLESEAINELLEKQIELLDGSISLHRACGRYCELIGELTGASKAWLVLEGNVVLEIDTEPNTASNPPPCFNPPMGWPEAGRLTGTRKVDTGEWQLVRIADINNRGLSLVLGRGKACPDILGNACRWIRLFGPFDHEVGKIFTERLRNVLLLIFRFWGALNEMNIPRGYFRQIWSRKDIRELQLPWEKERRLTISLSLDIRKSTFLMEKAVSAMQHARWLHAVTGTMRSLLLDAGAFFDKFTGDGVLAHIDTGLADCDGTEVSERQLRAAAERACVLANECLAAFSCLHKLLPLNQNVSRLGGGAAISIALGGDTVGF